MRKIILILIYSLGLYVIHAQEWDSQPQWEYVNTLQNEWMRKICTQGLDTVYVVGENGLIARSADRALTWEKQYPVNTHLNDIIFCNHKTGFAVGNDGIILKTTDAGDTWVQINSGTTESINSIAATGLDNIWAVGDNGTVLNTIHAGDSWITENVIVENRNLYDVEFKDTLGYITGESGKILKTTNKGTTWQEYLIFENTPQYAGIYSLCITENYTYALQNAYNGVAEGSVVFTENNDIWSTLDDSSIYFYKNGVYFLNDSYGWVCSIAWTTGSNWVLSLHQTYNGGVSWTENYNTSGWYLGGNISFRSNFSFSKDNSFGYCQTGQILLRTPYTGEFATDIKQVHYSDILFKEYGGYLQITNCQQEISLIRIISFSGTLICEKSYSSCVDTNCLPQGAYLIYVCFADHTTGIYKWLKN